MRLHAWSPVCLNLRTVLLGFVFAGLGAALPVWGQSSALLDSVKQNPQQGKDLCQQLRQLNAEGQSFTSSQVTATVARQRNLSSVDAEVLVTYVVGIYCPDVR
ncbi:MAG: hypothetical protein VKM92_04515 [Cyanobacteriota bacterium]|nr:hypothetical protein [Cyanobacteriota bacterium]